MTIKKRVYKEPAKPVGTVAELFAGVGGFRIGLAAAGWKTVFSNQWEPSTKVQHASDVYVHNFGPEGHSNENIAMVEKLPSKVDLLVGGFPCQDYSVAKSLNSSLGLSGKKGVLWWEILRLVKRSGHKPRFIFLENVDRLLKSPSSQRGRDFAVMLNTLGSAGYEIEWRVINSAEYGFPQRRKRVFIVARQKQTGKKDPLAIILKTGILARALPVLQSESELKTIDLNASPDLLSETFNADSDKSPFLNSGYFHNGVAYTIKTSAIESNEKLVLGDIILDSDLVPEEYWIPENRLPAWRELKDAKSIERVHKASGVKYNYAEGKMAFPDLLSNPSRTILTGEGGNTPSRFKHIIQVGNRWRRLTPIELERLNGFPDDWTKFSSEKKLFPMGNAPFLWVMH